MYARKHLREESYVLARKETVRWTGKSWKNSGATVAVAERKLQHKLRSARRAVSDWFQKEDISHLLRRTLLKEMCRLTVARKNRRNRCPR
jgi:hypothetical protein